ncbi:hypothetical protein [Leisingera sp. ANG-M1]|uniref:hypothetical protein n=1 Tax=Leisingera sp. ANG-M1 TaxID=1577895 RepID=UPI00126A110C|nr:hypothetical protein [Leisingera sp. ANG-M1]
MFRTRFSCSAAVLALKAVFGLALRGFFAVFPISPSCCSGIPKLEGKYTGTVAKVLLGTTITESLSPGLEFPRVAALGVSDL